MYPGPPRSPQSNNTHNQFNQTAFNNNNNQRPGLQPPPPPSFLNVNNHRGGVYTSMIQPMNNAGFGSGGGLGRLENMGRVIKEDPDPVIKVS